MREHEVERVVVGLPLTLRGERGAQALETEAFVDALRGVVDVPVETYDERFTTAIAAREGGGADEDARAAAHLLESYLAACGCAVRRLLGLARRRVVLGVRTLAGCMGDEAAAAGRDDAAARAPADHLPGGVHAREMADRVAAVREIAIDEARGDAAADEDRLPAGASGAPRRPRSSARTGSGSSIEGFLFPATYEFTKLTSSARLVRDQLAAFRRQVAQGRSPLRAVEEPHAVRRPHHRVDDREGDRCAGGAAPRRRGRSTTACATACRSASTRRSGTAADVPGTEPLKESDLESDDPYNTRNRLGLPPTPISNPGLASMRAAANPARVDYLYFVRKPASGKPSLLHREQSEFCQKSLEYGFGGC